MAKDTDFNDFHSEANIPPQIDGSAPAGGSNGAAPGGEEAPRPLQRDLPPATPFPAAALGSLLGGAALKMHEVIQAPLAICGNTCSRLRRWRCKLMPMSRSMAAYFRCPRCSWDYRPNRRT